MGNAEERGARQIRLAGFGTLDSVQTPVTGQDGSNQEPCPETAESGPCRTALDQRIAPFRFYIRQETVKDGLQPGCFKQEQISHGNSYTRIRLEAGFRFPDFGLAAGFLTAGTREPYSDM